MPEKYTNIITKNWCSWLIHLNFLDEFVEKNFFLSNTPFLENRTNQILITHVFNVNELINRESCSSSNFKIHWVVKLHLNFAHLLRFVCIISFYWDIIAINIEIFSTYSSFVETINNTLLHYSQLGNSVHFNNFSLFYTYENSYIFFMCIRKLILYNMGYKLFIIHLQVQWKYPSILQFTEKVQYIQIMLNYLRNRNLYFFWVTLRDAYSKIWRILHFSFDTNNTI